MLNVFFSPRKTIAEAKHQRSFISIFLLLVLSAISTFLGTLAFVENVAAETVLGALIGMGTVFVGTVVLALLVSISMNVLTGTKGFYEALTTLVVPVYVGTVGFLVASLLSLIPYAGPALFGAVMVGAVTLASVFLLKLGMELYNTDVLTVIIGIGVVVAAVGLGVYFGWTKTTVPTLIETALQGVQGAA